MLLCFHLIAVKLPAKLSPFSGRENGLIHRIKKIFFLPSDPLSFESSFRVQQDQAAPFLSLLFHILIHLNEPVS
jgi:hypothetical protein